MKCPKCMAEMAPTPAGEVAIDRCTKCGGLFLDAGEYEHLKEAGLGSSVDTGDAAVGKMADSINKIRCPRCAVEMLRLAVPGQGHIHYESCPVCYGAYFDAGEFADYQSLSLGERVKRFFSTFRRRGV